MFRIEYASPHTLEMLADKGAEILQVGFNEHLVTFKKGGLDEMKRKMQKEKEVKVKAKAKSNTKVNGKANSKPEAKKQGNSRTTKELKAQLKKKGVRFTQIMKKADMLEIADYPEREKQVIERACNSWKAYLKELEERKKLKE